MKPTLLLLLFALASSVLCLNAYSMNRNYQPLSMDGSDLFQTGRGVTIDAATHGRLMYGSSSKEDDDILGEESHTKFPHMMWGVRSLQRPLFRESNDPSGDGENLPLIMSSDGDDYPDSKSVRQSQRMLMELAKVGNNPSSAKRTGEKISKKKEGHSLSIVQPLDVLRHQIMLEMARRRLENNRNQIEANKVILANMGKRNSVFSSSAGKDQSAVADRSTLKKRNQREDHFSSDQVSASEEFEV